MRNLRLAILTERHDMAVAWLQATYGDDVVIFNRVQATGTVRLHNVDRDFVIIGSDHEERLSGQELMGFEVVGRVRPSCIEMAKTRVRS